jgi:streptomycin 6-kinase
MAAWSRKGPMIEILSADPSAVLMPKLSGPSLGDLARQGADDRACHLLAETAKRLHAHAPEVQTLPAISDWFGALFDLRYDGSCAAPLRRDMLHAGAMARDLLASTHCPCPLHGDLHHDNVIVTDKGPIAFDAKGVVGDRAYELANALRNPKGLEAELRDPERLRLHLKRYAAALGVSRPRLAAWAAAKCALSIAWRAKGVLLEDREADLLCLMLDEANDPEL